jgi:CRP-like cAMP-binding protein
MKAKTIKKNGAAGAFDPQVFLDTAGVARKVAEFRRGESVYSQGEAADTVMYVQKGGREILRGECIWKGSSSGDVRPD